VTVKANIHDESLIPSDQDEDFLSWISLDKKSSHIVQTEAEYILESVRPFGTSPVPSNEVLPVTPLFHLGSFRSFQLAIGRRMCHAETIQSHCHPFSSQPDLLILNKDEAARIRAAANKSKAYILWPDNSKPSIKDAADTWNLTDDQRLPFFALATTLSAHLQGEDPPQLRMLVSGEPGSGKSRIILAFLWYAYQMGASNMIAVMAYTWRAALHITSPTHADVSTCNFFGLLTSSGSIGQPLRSRVETNLEEPLWSLLIDEISFFSGGHLLTCETSAAQAMISNGRTSRLADAFGGLHVITFGDFDQHQPPHGLPLFCHPKPCETLGTGGQALQRQHEGRRLWEKFDTIFFLQQQHRFGANNPQQPNSGIHATTKITPHYQGASATLLRSLAHSSSRRHREIFAPIQNKQLLAWRCPDQ